MKLCSCSVAVAIFDSNCDWKESNFYQTWMHFYKKNVKIYWFLCSVMNFLFVNLIFSRENEKNKMNNMQVSLRNNLFSPIKINSIQYFWWNHSHRCSDMLVWFGRDVEKCVHICIYHGDAFFSTAQRLFTIICIWPK